MALEASKESKKFEQTLEDLTDDAEMADGHLVREKVDALYLRRGIDPDEAIRLEKALRDKGFVIKESMNPHREDTEVHEGQSIAYASATDHLIALARKVKLLTPSEEAAHGEAVQKAALLLEKPETERSDIEDRVIAAGKKSFDVLVRHNIRLVTSFVFDPRYRHRYDVDDMVQMGLLGLMRAAERFDPAHGCRFSTYAMWWIRQSIHRGIDNEANTIRLPVHMIEHVRKYKKALRTLNFTDGKSAKTVERVAESLGWKTEYAARVAQIAEMRMISMETPIGEEDDAVFGDLITDRLPDPEDMAIANDTALHVQALIAELPDERYRDVIRRRFGLEGPEETLESIGQRYNVTRERIRQIESKALKKLRRRATRRKRGLREKA